MKNANGGYEKPASESAIVPALWVVDDEAHGSAFGHVK
jgi:hypothetical protein